MNKFYLILLSFLSTLLMGQTVGGLDSDFMSNPGIGGPFAQVYTINTTEEGSIYVGGNFSTYHEQPAANLVKLHPNGELDTSFQIDQLNASVRDIIILEDGKLLVALFAYGPQYTFNGNPVKSIIRLNTDGSLDPTFEFSMTGNKLVLDLDIMPNGNILATGTYGFLVQLESDGTLIKDFNEDGAMDNYYFTQVLASPDDKIYVIGGFTNYRNSGYNQLVKIDYDGTVDTSFQPHLYNSEVLNVFGVGCIDKDGYLVIGASHTEQQVYHYYHLYKYDVLGNLPSGFEGNDVFPSFPNEVVLLNDGNLAISCLGSQPGFHSERLRIHHPNGSLNTNYSFGTNYNYDVYALHTQKDGKLLVGGSFDNFNGTDVGGIARHITEETSSVPNTSEINSKGLIYPNPAKDYFVINANELNGEAQVKIFDVNGNLVFNLNTHINQTLMVNNLQLSPGVYFVNIVSNTQSFNQKLLVK